MIKAISMPKIHRTECASCQCSRWQKPTKILSIWALYPQQATHSLSPVVGWSVSLFLELASSSLPHVIKIFLVFLLNCLHLWSMSEWNHVKSKHLLTNLSKTLEGAQKILRGCAKIEGSVDWCPKNISLTVLVGGYFWCLDTAS